MSAPQASSSSSVAPEGPRENSWIDEQAAEYADLVGSFVESVIDSDTDEMIEYQLIWEGGDLGVALTPVDNTTSLGVQVSRVTGKGFPFGIKNVGPGDILLSINLRDTTKLTLDQVVAYLQECDLPATLRFKKVSPDMDKITPAPVPRQRSTFTITSNGPTSPQGSKPVPGRGSHKGNAYGRPSFQQQQPRASMPSYQRPSDQRPSEASSTTSSHRQTIGSMPKSHIPAPVTAKPVSPPKSAPKPTAPAAQPAAPSPPKAPETVKKAPAPAPAPIVSAAPEPAPLPAPTATPPPAPVPAPAPAPVAVAPVAAAAAPCEEDVADEAADAVAELSMSDAAAEDSDSTDEKSENDEKSSSDRRMLRKQSSSMAMLGDFSTEISSMPILPEASGAPTITVVDGVMTAPPAMEYSDSEDDISPVGHQIQPIMLTSSGSVSSDLLKKPSVDDLKKPDVPRDSIKVVTDSGRMEPLMKSQPIGTLHELCAKGNLRFVVQHLRVEGPEDLITREPNHGQTCLHLAVKSGNVQLVKLILDQYKPIDALINLEDDKANTALHFAATKTPGMVHLLLENGASANVKNSRKLTPLIISVITSKDDNVIIPRMLLKFGANPNDMHDGQTVIHTAIGTGRLQIAGALVKAGAKMDVEDSDGKNVFEKLDRKSTRFLISHIYFPPTYITEKERADCMLCHKKIGKFGHRKYNCTHCGRFCCHECCSLTVEMVKFPMGFPGRVRRGAAVHDPKRVCKTCFNVFKERNEEPQKQENRFMNRIIGVEWDEINPNKLQQARAAGRRGERD